MRFNRVMISAAAALASGGLVAAFTPASAAPRPEPGRPALERPADPEAPPPPQAKRYCLMAEITGTRIPQKVCKTKSEWAAQGVDIAAQ